MNLQYIDPPYILNSLCIGDVLAEALTYTHTYCPYLIGGQIPNMERLYPHSKFVECMHCAMINDRKVLWTAVRRHQVDSLIIEKTPDYECEVPVIVQEAKERNITAFVIDSEQSEESILDSLRPIVHDNKRIDRAVKRLQHDKERLAQLKATPIRSERVLVLLGVVHPSTLQPYVFALTPESELATELLTPMGLHVITPEGTPTMKTGVMTIDMAAQDWDQLEVDTIACVGDSLAGFEAVKPVLAAAKQDIPIWPLPFYDRSLRFRKTSIFNSWVNVFKA